MNRFRRTHELWNWLPAFRAVAETGRLDEAAKRVGVSRSAISRTVTLLEERLGRDLFERVGRGLRLTVAGADLLEASRDAMRSIDDGLERALSPNRAERIALATSSSLVPVAARSALTLSEAYPGLSLGLVRRDGALPGLELLRGEIDLAVGDVVPTRGRFEWRVVGTLSRSVYAAVGNATSLASKSSRAVSPDSLRTRRFAVARSADGPQAPDGWPDECPRTNVIECADVAMTVDCALQADCLVVLPETIAGPLVRRRALRPLDVSELRPLPVCFARRPRLRTTDKAHEALFQCLERELVQLSSFTRLSGDWST